MRWYTCCWDHARRGKWNGFFSFLTSQETLVEIKDMVLQARWADLISDWHWKVKVWVIFPLPHWQNGLVHSYMSSLFPSSLCVSTKLLYLHDELARETIKWNMGTTKHNNFFRCTVTLMLLLLHPPEWQHWWSQKRAWRRLCQTTWCGVCFHGYKMTHGSRSFIGTGWKLRLCHALKYVAQGCSQIYKTWLVTVLDNLV